MSAHIPSSDPHCTQVYPTLDAVCNKFKSQPIAPQLAEQAKQAAAVGPQYGAPYQATAAQATAPAAAYQHPAYAAGASQYLPGAYAQGMTLPGGKRVQQVWNCLLGLCKSESCTHVSWCSSCSCLCDQSCSGV